MPPGAKKKAAAKRKKELERKERLVLQNSHHQQDQQELISHQTHGNGHHHHHQHRHHEEKEEDGKDSEARSPTHSSPHYSSHHSSQSEAEDCEEKTGSLMAAAGEEENGVPLVAVEEEKHEALPAPESVAKAEDDVIVESVTDDVVKEEKPEADGSTVAPVAEEALGRGNEVHDEVPEVASADDEIKDKDLEEKADSVVEVAVRQDDEVRDGVAEETFAVEVVRQEDEVGDVVGERVLEESSAIEVIRQIDEVTEAIHEESSAVEVVRQIDEVTDQLAGEISAVEVVRQIDEFKLLEQKIVEVILPSPHDHEPQIASMPDVGYETVNQPFESTEAKTEPVPNVSGGIMKQPQECHGTCCGSNRADASPVIEVVPRAPLVAERAKWWSCCGLFDVFVGSGH